MYLERIELQKPKEERILRRKSTIKSFDCYSEVKKKQKRSSNVVPGR